MITTLVFLISLLCFPTVNPPQFNVMEQPTIYDLEISINYRRKEMLKTVLRCHRLQLHYPHEARELNVEHICFPSTNDLIDHKQVLDVVFFFFVVVLLCSSLLMLNALFSRLNTPIASLTASRKVYCWKCRTLVSMPTDRTGATCLPAPVIPVRPTQTQKNYP